MALLGANPAEFIAKSAQVHSGAMLSQTSLNVEPVPREVLNSSCRFLSLAMLSLLGLGDTWQPDARILVPQLLPDLRQITNAFAKSSEHCLRAHVAWLTKSGAEQAAPAMTGRIATMDEDRISGTARNVGGKIEEGVGRLTGDARTQIQGKLDQAAGAAQDLYGQTADAARDHRCYL